MGKMDVKMDYMAAGGNRHPSAADWASELLAFGTGNNIALWNPEDSRQNGLYALLSGHTDRVNVVKLCDVAGERRILSGSADKTIRIWTESPATSEQPFQETDCLTAHEGSINTISVSPSATFFVSGAADGTIRIWSLPTKDAGARLVQSLHMMPRFLPLATAMVDLEHGAAILAVAGTSSSIQLYVRPADGTAFERSATLTGHESWIRSLDFARDGGGKESDLLLASASQDKFIRVWRFSASGQELPAMSNSSADLSSTLAMPSLSNKAHEVYTSTKKLKVTFEALLVGHEDWIYSARWAPRTDPDARPTLLSASADNSLALWDADEASGVWICNARLGEISAQKGSTTATGSTGGFWTGLWDPQGLSVVSLGRTGSWRKWEYERASDMWMQVVGISGHTQEVQSLAWAPDGSYLLTISSDQTTRMFAQWKREDLRSWHEMARPQIHGYDLNCVDTLTANRFTSGADEKLLRVFNKPRAIGNLLSQLSRISSAADEQLLPDAANIPVLGLSNKAITAVDDNEPADGIVNGEAGEREAVDPASVVHKSTLKLSHPPFEDHLARHTLWPEHEKLYGHGYEISAVAASHDGKLLATACKASSLDHAVIRLYDTEEWREVKPPLTAHSLTVTSLAFSGNDRFLLSVGRDRQWAVFVRDEAAPAMYRILTSNPKGHARMILDCSWAPGVRAFATAGRDKAVKLWRLNDEGTAECSTSITARASVTAVAFALQANAAGELHVAYGTEEGGIEIATLDGQSLQVRSSYTLPLALCPSKAINGLRWRPYQEGDGTGLPDSLTGQQLAAVSDDTSVRIYNINIDS